MHTADYIASTYWFALMQYLTRAAFGLRSEGVLEQFADYKCSSRRPLTASGGFTNLFRSTSITAVQTLDIGRGLFVKHCK